MGLTCTELAEVPSHGLDTLAAPEQAESKDFLDFFGPIQAKER